MALAVGQGCQGLLQKYAIRGIRGGWLRYLRLQAGHLRQVAGTMAIVLLQNVAGDGPQPSPLRRTMLKRRPCPQGSHKDLLHQVFGIFGGSDHQMHVRKNLMPISIKQGCHRFRWGRFRGSPLPCCLSLNSVRRGANITRHRVFWAGIVFASLSADLVDHRNLSRELGLPRHHRRWGWQRGGEPRGFVDDHSRSAVLRGNRTDA